MAKRASTESVAQIIDEAKRMAVTFQMKEFTDRAARELKKPTRQLKCKFCFDGHHTSECQNIPQAEKMAIAIQKKLCLTCHSPAFHLPVNCRGLRQNHLLCQGKICGKNREYHHNSICNKKEHTTNPQTMSKIPEVDDIQQE
ncbi:hypothetical protein B9Z55_027569 [Caenorhabditis nigoni]|uniref:Uncharacterized protein n=1 Tax=Caenorhabditis nigoni TaxID=1611254 RepID=A0A2G5SFQ8_9PELO|nr:hypothetical protein B9Z55_027569 [Caenorhabditis nigoni]